MPRTGPERTFWSRIIETFAWWMAARSAMQMYEAGVGKDQLETTMAKSKKKGGGGKKKC